MNIPEFLETINQYDILCISETHIDCHDLVDIPDYIFISLPKSKDYRRKSGGIGIYVRTCLSKFVTFHKSSNEYVLWVTIDKAITSLPEQLMIGAIYVPPENSRFFNIDEFDIFENSIIEMCHKHKYVMLAGDFNSRTGHLSDFVGSDQSLLNYFDIELEDQSALDQHTILEQLSIPLERSSEDSITNSHGSRLIDICRNNNLFILNSRVHKDTTGRFTFKYKSVIDYIISTAECFKHISNFDVIKTDTLLSDGHLLLHLEIGSKLLPTNDDIWYETHRSLCWDNELSFQFANNIDPMHLNAINELLDSGDRSQLNVERVTNEISLLFHNASSLTFTRYKNASRKHLPFKNKDKPWFGANCHEARKNITEQRKKTTICQMITINAC